MENQTRKALDKLGIEYIQEYSIGRYSIDFYLPQFKIAVETDGEYWHQDKNRDKRKEKYLHRMDICVIRIPEKEINKIGAINALRNHLENYIPLFIAHS